MTGIREFVGRRLLFPALRVMRAQLNRIDDPVMLRKLGRQLDALGHSPADSAVEEHGFENFSASWISVPEARPDRVLLYLHGGAFIAETPKFHGALVARICREAGARGFMPHYRLAPEHRFPAALDDCLVAYRHLLDSGYAPGKIVIAGDSAGGNLTLALLLHLREMGLALPAGAVVMSPVTDLTFSGDSVRRNDGVDDMFSAESLDELVPVYLADPKQTRNPLVSPVFGDYAGMPPLFLLVGSTELLLDDSVRVAMKCPGARLAVWDGMPHVFPAFDFLPEARAATRDIAEFVRDCVGASPQKRIDQPERVQGLASHLPLRARGWAARARDAGLPLSAMLYLALAFASAAVSMMQAMAWLGGLLAPDSLLGEGVSLGVWWMNAPAAWMAAVVVLLFVALEGDVLAPIPAKHKPGFWRRRWLPSAATLLFGAGCGLSVFLFLRSWQAWTARRS